MLTKHRCLDEEAVQTAVTVFSATHFGAAPEDRVEYEVAVDEPNATSDQAPVPVPAPPPPPPLRLPPPWKGVAPARGRSRSPARERPASASPKQPEPARGTLDIETQLRNVSGNLFALSGKDLSDLLLQVSAEFCRRARARG